MNPYFNYYQSYRPQQPNNPYVGVQSHPTWQAYYDSSFRQPPGVRDLERRVNQLERQVNQLERTNERQSRQLSRLNRRLRDVERRLNIPFTAASEDDF